MFCRIDEPMLYSVRHCDLSGMVVDPASDMPWRFLILGRYHVGNVVDDGSLTVKADRENTLVAF